MPSRIALHRAAAALAEARALEATAQAEVARVTEALDGPVSSISRPRQRLRSRPRKPRRRCWASGNRDRSKEKRERANSARCALPAIGVERAGAVVSRLERRLTAAIEARDRTKSAVAAADLQHRKCATQVLAEEANAIARELAEAERTAAACWRRLDTLSRMWIGGADAGVMPFAPAAVTALQNPPRLARIDLPAVAIYKITQQIAGDWRARFAELLADPSKEEGAEAA
jgi:hypothetical protein